MNRSPRAFLAHETPDEASTVSRPSRGVATALLAATSSQFGAASGATAFAGLSPIGVVAVRQLVVACVLLPTVRPDPRCFTRTQWRLALSLGAVVIAMNCGLALAVDRIGLALVTLEFLGPLAGAAAALGVHVLLLPGASSDWVGIGFGCSARPGGRATSCSTVTRAGPSRGCRPPPSGRWSPSSWARCWWSSC